MRTFCRIFSLLVVLLAGCGDETPAYLEDALAAYTPKTLRRVDTLKALPPDVLKVLLKGLNPNRGRDPMSFPPRLREHAVEIATRDGSIQDRLEPWTGGCSAGNHFLEAGETEDGWWVYYEAGGMVTQWHLVLIGKVGGVPKFTANFTLWPPLEKDRR